MPEWTLLKERSGALDVSSQSEDLEVLPVGFCRFGSPPEERNV